MRFPQRRSRREPVSEDLSVEMTIRWGLTTIVVATSLEAPRLWLHAVHLYARAQRRVHGSPIDDAHSLDIPVPIRMHPGGSIDAHWRPTSFDLEDPEFLRPRFTATAAVSLPRMPPVLMRPPVSVVDDFEFDGHRYVLRSGSELDRQRRKR